MKFSPQKDLGSPVAAKEFLRRCWSGDGLAEIAALADVLEREDYHPEGNTRAHMELVMEQAFRMGLSEPERLACLLHDIGKGVTGADPQLIEKRSHKGHDDIGAEMMEGLFLREGLPKAMLGLCREVSRWHQRVHAIGAPRGAGLARMLDDLEADWAAERGAGADDSENFLDFADKLARVCETDARGRLGLENEPYPQARALRNMASARFEANSEEQRSERSAVSERIRKEKAREQARLSAENPEWSLERSWQAAEARIAEMQSAGALPLKPESLEARLERARDAAFLAEGECPDSRDGKAESRREAGARRPSGPSSR